MIIGLIKIAGWKEVSKFSLIRVDNKKGIVTPKKTAGIELIIKTKMICKKYIWNTVELFAPSVLKIAIFFSKYGPPFSKNHRDHFLMASGLRVATSLRLLFVVGTSKFP